MTTTQQDTVARANEIIEELRKGDSNIGSLLAEAIQIVDEHRLTASEWEVLRNYQTGFGYKSATEYYLRPPLEKRDPGYTPHEGMHHFEHPGQLVVIKNDGTQGDVSHEAAKRTWFFIGAPISRIQELAEEPGETSITELPDLTDSIGEQEGGKIALIMDKWSLLRSVEKVRNEIAAVLSRAVTPGCREEYNNDCRLQEIMKELNRSGTDVHSLITEAISLCGEHRLRKYEREGMELDRDGFSIEIGIDYYLKAPIKNFHDGYAPYFEMGHRQRPGKLIVLRADGTTTDVSHEFGKRESFFIGAPIARIQELSELPGDNSVIELPDLTDYIGKQEGGTIALTLEKTHLVDIVQNIRQATLSQIDLAVTPGRRAALEAALKKPRGL